MKYFLYALLALFVVNTVSSQNKTAYLFVGTYTDSKPGNGIYVYTLSKTGELKEVSKGSNLVNPSFLTISPNGQYLYSCTDTKKATEGSITSFKIDTLHGSLTVINKQGSGGANPAYLSVDKRNKFIVNAGYTGGNVSVLSVNANGLLGAAVQTIAFKDSSINKERQDQSHVHSAVFSPDYNFLFSPDLGADKIRAFKFNANAAKPLTEDINLTVKTVPGTGPRHIIFHPNKKFAYCTEEMGGMVSVYSYSNGRLKSIQRILSASVKAKEYATADLHISPDARFLYSSNRGENTIAIFYINPDGRLKLIGHESTFGEIPRNFAIDPSGNFLIVANQNSNNLIVFRREIKTGLLKRIGNETKVFNPSCIQIREYGR